MKKFTITSIRGKSFTLSFTHICYTPEKDKSAEDFYIANDLLRWGILYEVGGFDISSHEGHVDEEIAVGLSMKEILAIIGNLSKRIQESTQGEWELKLPDSYQWVTAYNKLRFKTESDKRIYEATTTQEPLYSTRDRALMQPRRFLCYSGSNSKFQYGDHRYESGEYMFHVGIRLVLRKKDIKFDETVELLSTAGKILLSNKEKIAPVLKSFFNRCKQ